MAISNATPPATPSPTANCDEDFALLSCAGAVAAYVVMHYIFLATDHCSLSSNSLDCFWSINLASDSLKLSLSGELN